MIDFEEMFIRETIRDNDGIISYYDDDEYAKWLEQKLNVAVEALEEVKLWYEEVAGGKLSLIEHALSKIKGE